MPPERWHLVIDVEKAAVARRQLGPVTWVVLEAIASSTTDGRGREAACSSRSLAELVGVSKDAVARSIRTLIEQGLVVRSEQRDEVTGRFGPVRYQLDFAAVGITVVADRPTSTDQPNSISRPIASFDRQLTLLS